MTNEEALKVLKEWECVECLGTEEGCKACEKGQAIDMAIFSLSKTISETEIRAEEYTEYFKKSEVLEMLEKINKAVDDGEGYQYEEWVDYVE